MKNSVTNLLFAFACSVLFTACSEQASEPERETVGKEIADDYNRALEKAREVEDQMQEQKEEIDKALQDVEGQLPEQ